MDAHASAAESPQPQAADEELIQVVYASAATETFDDAALVELLEKARTRNAANGVSGLLLYVDGSFIQVLEGPPDQVEATFARIGADPRHGRVVVLMRGSIDERRFADWAMGFAATQAIKADLGGFSDYLRSGTVSHAVEAALGDRVFALLGKFHDGAYRA